MRRSKQYITLIFITTFSLILFNCAHNSTDPEGSGNGGNDLTNTGNVGLVGAWQGTYFEFTNQNNPSQSVDLTQYGVVYSMVINPDSTYSSSTAFSGQAMTENGVIHCSGDQITIAPDNGQPRTGTFTLVDDVLSIVVPDQEFDFDQDGTAEPATLKVKLEKVN